MPMPPPACRCFIGTGASARIRAQRSDVPQGLSGPRLRDRHQFQSVPRLHHGGKLRDDADLGAGARGLRPQPFLQEQLRASSNGPTPTASSTICEFARGTDRQVRGSLRPGRGRARAGRGARAAEPRHPPLPAQAHAGPALRAEARGRAPLATASNCSTISGARCRPAASASAARDDDARRKALLGLPEENLLYFLEKTAPRLGPWQREILRIVRHDQPVFLSAAPNQGDERRLRHLQRTIAS